MTEALYYQRPNKRIPAKEWVDDKKNSNIWASIYVRILRLQKDDLQSLIGMDIVVPITNDSKGNKLNGLYELKERGKGWRLAFYHDITINKYIFICGWRRSSKKKDIDKAHSLATEYIKSKG